MHQEALRESSLPCIAVTVGDPAGIGPEVARAALASTGLARNCRFEVVGGAGNTRRPEAVPGRPSFEGALAALEDLEAAVAGALEGRFAAVVTGPIHKARMKDVGFDFPGQTEFFATRCGVENYTMCLTGGALCVGLVTAHVAYKEVPRLLSVEGIEKTGLLLADFLHMRLGRPPKIAVAGLNPHAGENGIFGSEEGDLIGPAVEVLKAGGRAVFTGPWSPDTVFYRASTGEFDGVVCMYHYQGLIPLKLLAFHEGVNV
ncbi:MAG: 4-hydroxythreonine-4-phosphate dehydrogenase PdxA, partial [Verrucomicrobiota bacterium]